MTYELTKQLKDARFPNSESWRDNGSYFDVDTPGGEGMEVPTLSELIEACGNSFGGLQVEWSGALNDPRTYKAWNYHWSSQPYLLIEGSSPEEAVAKLWLELNKGTKPYSREEIEEASNQPGGTKTEGQYWN